MDPNIKFDQLIGASFVILFIVFVSLKFGEIVFAPLQRFSLLFRRRRRMRFRIVDLLVLVAHIQIILGLLVSRIDLSGGGRAMFGSTVFVMLLGTLCVTWWWSGIRMLDQANIENNGWRIFILALLVPLGYSAALSLPLVIYGFLGAAAILFHVVSTKSLRIYDPDLILAMKLIAAGLIAGTTAWGCRVTCWYLFKTVGKTSPDLGKSWESKVVADQAKERHNMTS